MLNHEIYKRFQIISNDFKLFKIIKNIKITFSVNNL